MNLIVIAVIKLSFYAVYVDWQWQPRNVYFYQQRNLQNVLAVYCAQQRQASEAQIYRFECFERSQTLPAYVHASSSSFLASSTPLLKSLPCVVRCYAFILVPQTTS